MLVEEEVRPSEMVAVRVRQGRLRAGGLDGVGDASVYGTLRRLYASGALTSYVVPSDEGPHRKYYGITTAGRAQLKQEREDWQKFSSTVTRLLDQKTQTQGADA